MRITLMLMSSALTLTMACGAETKAKAPPADCAHAIDHGIALIKATMSAGPSLKDTCAAMDEAALSCFEQAKTSADVVTCSQGAATGTITIRPDGAAVGTREARCAAADASVKRVQAAAVDAARDAQIATCDADHGRAVKCQLAAATAQAWMACAAQGPS